MSRPSATELAARKERLAAIRGCRCCDPCGWRLGSDGTPIDPAIRCAHTSPPTVRDITAPMHEPDLFSQPRHSRAED